jgi:WD40 repeat protein
MDGVVRVFETDNGALSGELRADGPPAGALAMSGDGRRLAGATDKGTVRLWRLDSDRSTPYREITPGQTQTMVFTSDGSLLATGNRDGTVRLWNAEDGAPVDTGHLPHIGRVLAMTFSADGQILASSGDDRTVHLSNRNGQSFGGFPTNHIDRVLSLAFGRDSRLLATGSADGTVQLWRSSTGDAIGNQLTGHTGDVRSVAFTPDGRHLVSAGIDGSVRTWPAVATPEMLCDKLSGDITPDQWRDWISDDDDIGYRTLCS